MTNSISIKMTLSINKIYGPKVIIMKEIRMKNPTMKNQS